MQYLNKTEVLKLLREVVQMIARRGLMHTALAEKTEATFCLGVCEMYTTTIRALSSGDFDARDPSAKYEDLLDALRAQADVKTPKSWKQIVAERHAVSAEFAALECATGALTPDEYEDACERLPGGPKFPEGDEDDGPVSTDDDYTCDVEDARDTLPAPLPDHSSEEAEGPGAFFD